ncbi:hypothetical protein B0H14DRAFT_748028 [Mycena olivaceomarginata]|nr:hypothetical protein B0H14DRAFT_748028 [Mycena olivaceomarginata]
MSMIARLTRLDKLRPTDMLEGFPQAFEKYYQEPIPQHPENSLALRHRGSCIDWEPRPPPKSCRGFLYYHEPEPASRLAGSVRFPPHALLRSRHVPTSRVCCRVRPPDSQGRPPLVGTSVDAPQSSIPGLFSRCAARRRRSDDRSKIEGHSRPERNLCPALRAWAAVPHRIPHVLSARCICSEERDRRSVAASRWASSTRQARPTANRI